MKKMEGPFPSDEEEEEEQEEPPPRLKQRPTQKMATPKLPKCARPGPGTEPSLCAEMRSLACKLGPPQLKKRPPSATPPDGPAMKRPASQSITDLDEHDENATKSRRLTMTFAEWKKALARLTKMILFRCRSVCCQNMMTELEHIHGCSKTCHPAEPEATSSGPNGPIGFTNPTKRSW